MTRAWGRCGECGFPAATCEEFLRHLDQHAGVERPEDWYLPERRRSAPAQWDDQTAPVVFVNPADGSVRYPGRNDARCPEGYERRHLRSLREVERFEREHSVRSEMAWYDKGSGRGFDDYYRGQKVTA